MTQAPTNRPALIRAEGITKSFGAVKALKDIKLEIRAGEVHSLVGANGAGKSTFLNVVGGVVIPDHGELFIDGEPVSFERPRDSAERGFSFIWQELALVPEFSAIDNMTIGLRPNTPLGFGDRSHRRKVAKTVAERLDLRFDLDKPVRQLTVAERGMVAIGRALVSDARFVSMDEPTAALSDVECERLFAVTRDLRDSGVAIAYVSHRLDEIEELSDRVTVFKDGQVVNSFERGAFGREDLVMAITGAKSVEASRELPSIEFREDSAPILSVRNLAGDPRVHDVSFDLRPGEILGLGGVVGAGRTEVLRMLFGVDRPTSGTMYLNGSIYSPRSVKHAIQHGVALVPEERRSQALVMSESIVFNINMGGWKPSRAWPWSPLISDQRAHERAQEMSNRLGVKAGSVKHAMQTLSGGNQQKVVFGRWLLRESKVLLLDEPTRGVDIGARRQLWATAEEFAAAGGAVIVACSELEELSVCHRVVVMVEGRSIAEINGPGVTEQEILEAIYSQKGPEST